MGVGVCDLLLEVQTIWKVTYDQGVVRSEMYNRNKKATIKIKIKINFSKKIND
jgi:hypothetical protein